MIENGLVMLQNYGDAFCVPFFAFVLNFAFNTYKIRGY